MPTGATQDVGMTDEITFEEVISRIWTRKTLVVVVALGAAAIASAIAIVIPKTYIASTVVSPVASNSNNSLGGGLSSIASQFGGLASLAGISVPGDSRKYESLAILQSEALTEKYIADKNLLPILYASEWDAAKGAWTTSDPRKMPTLWKANRDFKGIRAVSNDNRTQLTTVSIKWKDPKLAATWANDLVKLTNEYLRNQAISEAENNIGYLNAQAAKTDVVAVKQGIYSMIQVEINKAMTAKGTADFALKVLDPAVPPEKPSSPKLSIWLFGGLFGGGLIAAAFAYYLETKERKSKRLASS
jgi:uncharacterized protein involved in exopolysaccharide biosynthesis